MSETTKGAIYQMVEIIMESHNISREKFKKEYDQKGVNFHDGASLTLSRMLPKIAELEGELMSRMPTWISITERLPEEEDVKYLCYLSEEWCTNETHKDYLPHQRYEFLYFYDGGFYFDDGDECKYVTHFQCLPTTTIDEG